MTDLLVPIAGLLLTIALFLLLTKLLQKYSSTYTNINSSDSVKLLNTKYIDNNNKLITIVSNNTKYLVLVGKNNHLLLDKHDEPQN